MTGLYVASNTQSLGAQIQLQRNITDLGDVLTRLSTGLRINSGKDDPAGLIASELLKSDISATKQAIQNTSRANSVIAVADSALGQVSNLLNDIRVLVNASANTGAMTDDQIQANQLQVDASIDSIDRIAKTTNFQGQKLLDGSMGFSTTNCSTGPTSAISNVSIQQANFGTADSLDVNVKLLEASKRGTLIYQGTGVDTDTVVSIGGSDGSQVFKFGAGTTTAEMADAINRYTDSTGVQARVEGEASRGTVTMSSTGANNDFVITANEEGFDAGNYTFRIVQGETNDAYIVSDPNTNKPGVIEISLERAYNKSYSDVAGMFDVTLDTASDSAPTSISITQGDRNSAVYNQTARNAAGASADGAKTLQVSNAGTNGHMSNLNGWTVKIVDAADEKANTFDDVAKTVYSTGDDDSLTLNLARITGATVDHGTTASKNDLAEEATSSGVAFAVYGVGGMAVGDSYKLSGGAEAGELTITYKEGATAADIQNLINANTGAMATLADGVDGKTLMSNVIKGDSRISGDTALASSTTSKATAAEVVALINSKLGDKFTAAIQTGQTGAGHVTYQDASAIYGSVNSDNALRFSGMDDGPIVRLTTSGSDGTPVKNQALGVTLKNPTEKDMANGIHTKVLEIHLATDASGNSISTAADIVALFNSLTADQTGGVSASLVLPDGVDPNGRTWTTDICGNESVYTDCGSNYGNGIVDPTGAAGTCEIQENDLVLLGNNETLQATQAKAYITNSAPSTLRIATAADEQVSSSGVVGATATDGSVRLQTAAASNAWGGVNIQLGGTAATGGVTYDKDTNTFTVVAATDTKVSSYEAQLTAAKFNDAYAAVMGAGATIVDSTAANLVFYKADGTAAAADEAVTSPGKVTVSKGIVEDDYIGGVGQQSSGVLTDNTGVSATLIATNDAATGGAVGANGDSSALNGVSIKFVKQAVDAAKTAGTDETFSFDSKTGTLTIGLVDTDGTAANASTGAHALAAINAALEDEATAKAILAFSGSAQGLEGMISGDVTVDSATTAFDTVTAFDLDGVSVKMNGGMQAGDIAESAASTGTIALAGDAASPPTHSIKVTTDSATSSLNGISINFTSESAQAGFDNSTGALTVYLNPQTQALSKGQQLQDEVQQAVNGALNSQWEQIRQFTNTLEGPATVKVELGSATEVTDLLAKTQTDTSIKFPPNNGTSAVADSLRGSSVSDPAMIVKAKATGTEWAGVKIVFEQDNSMTASTTENAVVATSYKENADGTRVLTVKANASSLQNGTDGGINAAVLAKALNNDETFKKYFTAEAPIVSNDPTASKTNAVIHFGSGTVVNSAQTVGGYDIKTEKNDSSSNSFGPASSSGLAMTGNNDDNQRLIIEATETGASNFVDVKVSSGSFTTYCPLGIESCHLAGTDAKVTVNGQKATVYGDNFQVSDSGLQMSGTINNMTEGEVSSFTITGGGATFQLGPDVVSAQQIRLGIDAVDSTNLGGQSGKLYMLKSGEIADLKTNTKLADKIVQESINSIAVTRGRLGAIQKSTLEPNQAVLEDTVEQLSSAEALISNADFAEESSNLTRAQILVQSGQQVLSLANQFPQYAAALIR